MKRLFAIMAMSMGIATPLLAQDAYKLVVDYDRPGLNVPHWQVIVPPHGMLQYTGKPIKGNDPGIITFRISDAGRTKLGTLLEHTNGLSPCETKAKGIANMGIKTFEYTRADAPPVTCTFNFTDNKPLSEATTYLMSLTETLQTGIELERLHRYDRLGLDPVMIRLANEAKDGHAVEMLAIKPTLESLITDPALMERVRTKAQQLLDLAKQQETATP